MPMPGPVQLAAMAAKLGKTIDELQEEYGSVQHFLMVSGAIREIWYNSVAEILWISFNKVGGYPKYRFEGVEGSIVAGLVNASSAGNYYHNKIKGKYYTSTIRGPDEDDSRAQTFNLL